MPQNNHNQIQTYMRMFTQAVCQQKPLQFQMDILSQIKRIITKNPNNYYHPFYGCVTFTQVYEFIIQTLSHQHLTPILPFLLHVLSLMTKYWVFTAENLKQLYEGILSLFQQRTYCGENCFKFFTVLVETMQDQDKITHWEQTTFDHHNNCTSIKTQRSALQNYFVYHILNQLVAFANIFLDRSVIRNEQIQNPSDKKKQNYEQDSKINDSEGRSNSVTKSLENSNSQPSQPECQLYKIIEEQSVILSILGLFRACLSYDFAYVTRHEQQADYEPHKSPIILPTKYSKFCKFSEYDLFLKSQNTTQMLNYLYLVSSSYELKLQILKILQSMARIHFRYFKNKTYHKLHLEEIGYVVGNLMTGLDINQALGTSTHKKPSYKTQNGKINLALSLCQIVNILLYHQPTFYLVQNSLIQLILGNLETFILQQLLQPDYFQSELEVQPLGVSKEDLILLIQTFMGHIPKLKDLAKNYLHANDLLTQKVNQMFIKIGQRFIKLLCLDKNGSKLWRNKQNQKLKHQSNWKSKSNGSDKKAPVVIPEQSLSNQLEIKDQNNQCIEDGQKPALYGRFVQQDQKQETQTNHNPILIERGNSCKKKKGSDQQQRGKKIDRLSQNRCFLLAVVEQSGSVEHIRNIITIFRVYCPKHTYFQQFFSGKRSSSNLSYFSEKSSMGDVNQEDITFSFDKIFHCTQKWITTWICAFQHHFNFTGGHAREAQSWQVEIHNKFMIELLEDLNYAMKICCIQPQQFLEPELNKQLSKCILTALLFYTDKVTFDSKIGILQHNQQFGFDIELVLEWIILQVFNICKDFKEISYRLTIVTPILQMIQKMNYQRCVLDKMEKQNYSSRDLYSKYSKDLHQFLFLLLQFYKTTVFGQQIQSISKILVIKLRFLQETEDLEQYGFMDHVCLVQLSELFRIDPIFLFNLLEESSSNWRSRSKKWQQSTYIKIRDVSVKLFQKNNFFTQNIERLENLANQNIILYRFGSLASSLVKFIQIQRRLGQSQIFKASIFQLSNIFNEFASILLRRNIKPSCCCIQLLIPMVQLNHQLSFIKRPVTNFPTIISVFKNHESCISFYPKQVILNLMHLLVSILMRFNNIQFLSQECKEATRHMRPGSMVSCVSESFVWILRVLGQIRKTYGEYNNDFVKMQKEIIELGMCGYKEKELYKKSLDGILNTLELSLLNIQRQGINWQTGHHYIDENKKYIMLSISQYLYDKFFDHLNDRLIKSPHPFNTSNQSECCLKIDNAISVFYTYHHIFQVLYTNQLWVLQYVVQNKIIFDAIKYICEMGVNWVVRKLELWNKDEFEGLHFQSKVISPLYNRRHEDASFDTELGIKDQNESKKRSQDGKEEDKSEDIEWEGRKNMSLEKQSEVQDRDDKETKNQEEEYQKIEDRIFLQDHKAFLFQQNQSESTQNEQNRNH